MKKVEIKRKVGDKTQKWAEGYENGWEWVMVLSRAWKRFEKGFKRSKIDWKRSKKVENELKISGESEKWAGCFWKRLWGVVVLKGVR